MQKDDREMIQVILTAFVATTSVSLVAVVWAGLRLGGPLAALAAVGVQAAKVGLPVEGWRMWRRGARPLARALAGAWLASFLVCAAATWTLATAPRPAGDSGLAAKREALRSMERAVNSGDLDYEVERGYQRRVTELQAEIAELRTHPKGAVRDDSAQLLGLVGLLVELISSAGLLLLRWSVRPDELPEPEPITLAVIEPDPEPEPVTLLPSGPAFTPAIAPPDPAREAAWLWPGVAPVGAMTLLTGQPKIGKSQIAIHMAAVVSSGGAWPDGGAAEPGNVILMEIEDSHGDTRARLTAAGADLKRIVIRDREQGPLDLSTPEGMAVLRGQAAEMGGVRLAVLSPLLAFFGRAGATDDATVRARLAPLLQWAARERVAVLGLLHPAKNAGRALEAQFAGADAYRRAARSAFVAMIDASDPEPVVKRKRRVLVCAGVNGASDDFRLFYRIEGVETGGRSTSRVAWLPDVQAGDDEIAGDEAFTDGETTEVAQTEIAKACAIIGEMLPVGSRRSAVEIKAALYEAGLSKGTIGRAANRMGVRSQDNGVGKPATWSR
jgi:putative DNA primase/helicase